MSKQQHEHDLGVDWSTEPVPAYVTGVHVAQSPREFSAIFDESAPFPGRNARKGSPANARSRIVASLRFSPDVFFQVACTLASSWNRFVERNVPAGSPRPRFKLLDAPIQLEAVDDGPPKAS